MTVITLVEGNALLKATIRPLASGVVEDELKSTPLAQSIRGNTLMPGELK